MLSLSRAPQFNVRLRFVAGLMLVALTACGLFAQGSSTSLPAVASGNWAQAGIMATARSGAAAAVLHDGRIVVAGGTDASGNVLATVDIYSADGSFHAAAPMNIARTGHTATVILGGYYVLVAGGTAVDGSFLASAEVYDPVQNTWTMAQPAMTDARTGHTATLLNDGDVLIAGGSNSNGTLASLELFSAATETFSPVGAMSSPRQGHAATALNDGRVLIIGGSDPNGVTLATSDIYDPAAGAIRGHIVRTGAEYSAYRRYRHHPDRWYGFDRRRQLPGRRRQ